jgi:peptide/nickel transport system substrate-binding protein
MKRRWLIPGALLALAAAATFGLAACGGGDNAASDTAGGGGGSSDISAVLKQLGGPITYGTVAKGGTYRIANTDFAQSDGFDPTGEYFGSNWNIYNDLMLRTLVSYNYTAGPAGNELRPDLATKIPKPSADGLTYTFKLKDGITFGPPVNRPITSKDIAYAFKRIATPSVVAQYPDYFQPIKGLPEFTAGKAKTISGISTPDDKTITFTLTRPVGDFLFRVAMPATAPIPEEVAKCYTQPAEYGRYVISSGPYMIDGADKLDISSCASQKPISGFNPNTGLNLVRNPNYDPASDDTSVRQSNPDRFEISVNTNLANIFDKITRGELEGSFETPDNATLRSYIQDPANRDRLRVNSGDRIWFAYMDLTTPPFDDVHVRKAMNLVMDLEGVQRAWGGPVQGSTPTDLLPDTLMPELTAANYTPFQKPPFSGDVEAAKAEMKLSKYDTDKDGLCDAAACKGIVHLNRNFAPWSTQSPIIVQSAAKIGLQLETRGASRSAVNDASGRPGRKIPISSGNGWAKDFGDPSTFMKIYDGRNILADGNAAYSLVGLTPAKAKEVGADIPASGPPPSVDADIDACAVLSGPKRRDCWVALDKKLTEQIVPEIPLMDASALDIVGPAVTQYDYDQNGTEMALAKVAVDPSLQKGG